jgi:hypothetical protein
MMRNVAARKRTSVLLHARLGLVLEISLAGL